ncbi:glycosyltransferase [Falsiroseomonas oryzae]|uniref:glycosyltransferase n=1 Tax=Falsiroseomonas oryzae TaxID=2766473 RepID=UPI0022EB4BF6|nr:glycosyltransferase [Roseomonas sp. MO-31]
MSSARAATPGAAAAADGYIDFYGHASAAGGWLFCGWSRERWPEALRAGAVVAHFERGRVIAETLAAWHDRPDLGRSGHGVLVFVRAAERPLGEFLGLEVTSQAAATTLRIQAVRPLVHLREGDLVARARPVLLRSVGTDRPRLAGLLSRRPFTGADTLGDLSAPVQFEVDETILSPPDGLLLLGWCADPAGAVASIRIRRGGATSDPIAERWLRTRRPDVFEALAGKLGLADDRCGFVAYAPGCVGEIGPLYAEIELKNGEVGYKRLPLPARTGTGAMRRVLGAVELAPDEIASAFDRVLGPALGPINAARLARPRPCREVAFGTPPAQPDCSVIVPLYGRMDFLLYQLALFSEDPGFARHELIYVLDDPPRRRELLDLAHSAHRRFGVPFRVLLLEENLGFAPANNVGLAAARGAFTCYLNSDVMPEAPGWLDRMLDTLRADPGLGMAGALLLFEDGTVQHQGLTFERLPQLAAWPFPMHPGKGRLHRAPAMPVQDVEAVTGACMALRTDLARELGGFDESFAIGDFEDSDLCLRIRAKGLRIAVDHRARLYHLERQSQVTPDRMWRFNVTLLNAWTHTRRWFADATEGGSR